MASDIVIISGTAAACELAKNGVSVTIVERGDLASMAWKLWGGLVDNTPAALPVLERTPEVDGLVVAAGFSGHGFCLGPITGEIVADLATEGETRNPIAPFARDRLDAMTASEGVTLFG